MRLYDTLTRGIKDLISRDRTSAVSMYSCGPTVYRDAHIGNLRTFLTADLVARSLRYLGTPVKQVQNITDVGHMTDEVFGEGGADRMEIAAELQGLSPAQIASRYTDLFLADIDAIGIRRADAYPKASDHVPQMVALIQKLIENGHAYEMAGTVYFDTTSFARYGYLSRNTLDSLESDHRKVIADSAKKHPTDFVLWMAAGPNRLVTFESPWGRGYPGWHIECSAMSLDAFGEHIDIHTGGEDNVFPHHEDEIAQSEGAVGHQVVRHWLHSAHLLADGHKMSKSSRNDFTLRDLADRGHTDPRALRMLFMQSRYRSQMNFTFDALRSAEKGLARWRRLAQGWSTTVGTPDASKTSQWDQRFRDAISEDLDTPAALRLLGEVAASTELNDGSKFHLFERWDAVLGLQLTKASPPKQTPSHIEELVAKRALARAARDFDLADRLRNQIQEAGFAVLDSSDGTQVQPS